MNSSVVRIWIKNSKRQWQAKFSGANFFRFNIKDITSKIPRGSWSMAGEKRYVSGHLFPTTSSWVGIRIAYLLLPWRTPCPEQLGSPGVSFSGANPHGMALVRCVWEAEGKRVWSSLDGEESKSTHMWSSCFYIFRTDACTWSKVPHSSRTDFLL